MTAKRFLFIGLPILFGGIFLAALFVSASSANYFSGGATFSPLVVDQLSSRDDGISFRLNIPVVSVNNDGRIEAEGLDSRFANPGEPALPYFSKLVLLPPGADAFVSIVPGVIAPLNVGSVNLIPDKKETIIIDQPGFSSGIESQRIIISSENREVLPAIFPSKLFSLTEPMYLRDLRLVRLDIFPIRYLSWNGELLHVPQMEVEIRFVGADLRERKPVHTSGGSQFTSIADSVINPERASEWRSLPADFAANGPGLPIGQDVYKIAVDEDSIYELSYDDLDAAGMEVDNIDPTTFEMMHRGESVAYEYIGDSDDLFEPDESLRFYGWAFDGPRLEKQYINENTFWLWAGGIPVSVREIDSVTGTQVTSFKESTTKEPENIWFAGHTDNWDSFPNEPDAWYWHELSKTVATQVTFTYQIEIFDPAISGIDATIIAEFSSKNPYQYPITHEVSIHFNNFSPEARYAWFDTRNVNISGTIPLTYLNNGINALDVVLESESTSGSVYLNRVTVDYLRQLRAVDDELLFNIEDGGPLQFSINGFLNGEQSQAFVWNISNRLLPVAISSESISVTGSAGSYTYTFGTSYTTPTKYIVTTRNNVRIPVSISQYIPETLDREGQGADWVAISHADFLTEAVRLASHRSQQEFGGLSTHVVDIEDVINQYGYGLPLPEAIVRFLGDALSEWQTKPNYVVLIGDATLNPHDNLKKGKEWSDPQYLLTNLEFVDRFQGQIPSDLRFSTLVGDDLLPDIAVGRIPVQTADEAAAVVSKIINYEENRLLPDDWMLNTLFLADQSDEAGFFCDENGTTGKDLFPSQFVQSHYCLGQPPYTQTEAIRSDFLNKINNEGASLVNYRGHGSVTSWSGIIDTSHIDCDDSESCWVNAKPVVIITGDCLDAYFTVPNYESLGESLLQAENKGSAAHFSSTGLGLSFWHSKMIEAFYEGLFVKGNTAIGDAADYARIQYANWGSGHDSILFSFLLQGDPAMQIFQPSVRLSLSASKNDARPGVAVEYQIGLSNHGLFPGKISVENTLPPGLRLISATSSVTANLETIDQTTRFDLSFSDIARDEGMPWNATATIDIFAAVDDDASPGVYFDDALVEVSGLDNNAVDNIQSVLLRIWSDNPILLPYITNP